MRRAAEEARAELASSLAVSKRTGKPPYNPRPLRSAACIYKEARMNNVPYQSLVAENTMSEEHTSNAKHYLASKLWMPLIAIITVGLSVEAAVVYSKGVEDTERSKFQRTPPRSLQQHPEREVYTKSTSALIKATMMDMEQRSAKS